MSLSPFPSGPEPVGSAADARFLRLMAGRDEDIRLAEAALLVACHEYPRLDVGEYLSRVDELAAMAARRAEGESDVLGRIAALNRFVFGELGFEPNARDYYDPRNSYLNEVLDRRTGIPITLSVLYMEIGHRIGLPLQGVNFPGHFLVKCAVPDGTAVIDPFSQGAFLGLPQLQDLLRESQGGEVSRAIVASLLVAADNRAIVLRLLRNLKAIYLRKGRPDRALPVMSCILATAPAIAEEWRDRGEVFRELECTRAAASDFETYLRLAPDSADAPDVRARAHALRQAASRLN